MKNSNSISKMMLLIFITLSTFMSDVSAQEYVRIINSWKKDGVTDYKIHIEKATVDAGAAPDGWLSAQWEMEKVNGQNAYRIKNRWEKRGKTNYLHIENGKIEAGTIQSGWVSAMWILQKVTGADTYRIQNAWKTEQYLHIEGPTLATGPIQPGWLSAIWTLEGFQQGTPNLKKPETLKYNGKSIITFNGKTQQGGDCSLPDEIKNGYSMKKFAENHFLPACERHDHIYNNIPFIKAGITNGKEIADNIFYSDMIQICRNGNFEKFGEKLYCETIATTWYFFVANAQEGLTAYLRGQQKAEKSEIVSKNLAYARTIKKIGAAGKAPILNGAGVKRVTQWAFGTDNTLRTPNTTNNVTYDLTFQTGSMRGAGTDANVKIELIGTKGSTIPVQINSYMGARLHNAFQVAGQDNIKLITTDIGKITSVKVSHDNGGLGPKWYLSNLSIVKNGQAYSFSNDSWITGNDKKTLYPTPALRDYKIEVQTGDNRGAGTSANVFITLFGNKGQTKEIRLTSYMSGNAFENGDLDEATLANLKDIGTVNKVKIRHDNKNPRSGWYIDWIKVDNKQFNYNDWLEDDKLSATLR